jgi:hypothetical protein
MSNLALKKPSRRNTILASKQEDGLSSELILGAIAFAESLSGGKRKAKTI